MIVDIFYRLLLGHLVGDFVLQPLWVAIAKRDGWPGLILHVGVVAVTTGILIYGVVENWLLWTVVLFLLHLFLDRFRTFVFTDNAKGKGFILLIADQGIHVGSLVLISWMASGTPADAISQILGSSLSPTNGLLLAFSMFIIAFWVTPILEIEFNVAIMSFRGSANKQVVPIKLSDRVMGGVERIISLALFWFSYGVFAPLVFIPRFAWLMKQDQPMNKTAIYAKMGMSLVVTILLGVLLLKIHLAKTVL